jgi:hypothetical protein
MLGAFKPVVGCSCGGYPTVCESYSSAKAVFVGLVSSVQNTTEKDDDGEERIAGQKAWVQVEKVFKGIVKGAVLFKSYGSSCDPVYKEGQRWLFYGYFNEKQKAWEIHACDRSTLIQGANEDLLYLQGLPKSAMRTRIAGTVEHYEETVEDGFKLIKYLAGTKVTITGADKSYEVYTDVNGVYEVYGLPTGLYNIEPEIPPGMKIRFGIPHGPQEIINRTRLNKDAELVTVRNKLVDSGCVSVDFVISSETLITGHVIGADGKPLPHVCLKLEPLSEKVSPYFHIFDCTKEDGSYKLDDMPPGQYRILINDQGEIDSFAPFPSLYYPGVSEKSKATTISVLAGVTDQVYDIVVPSLLPTRRISGVLLYSDGKPVVDEFVWFRASEERKGFDGDTNARTDKQGHFELVVLDGWRGRVFGNINAYEGLFLNCPSVDKIIKTKGPKGLGLVEIESNSVEVETTHDIYDIKLSLPFPYCAKREDR